MQNENYGNYCEICGKEGEENNDIIWYEFGTYEDRYACIPCGEELGRRITDAERQIEYEEQFKAPYLAQLHNLSKKKLYFALQDYQYINHLADFINNVPYLRYTKADMIFDIEDYGILINFCNYLHTLL